MEDRLEITHSALTPGQFEAVVQQVRSDLEEMVAALENGERLLAIGDTVEINYVLEIKGG